MLGQNPGVIKVGTEGLFPSKTAVTGYDAIARALRGEYAKWGGMTPLSVPDRSARYRIYDGYAEVEVQPKFTLNPSKPVYTIGSCFARNVELHLHALGVPIASRFREQKRWVTEDRPNDAAILNRFTVTSIMTEALSIADPDWLGERLLYDGGGERAWDAYFSPGQALMSRQTKLEIRKEVLSYQQDFVRRCGAVFVTLGLSEAIHDNVDQLDINGLPALGRHWNAANGHRFEGRVIGADEALSSLEAMRDAIRGIAPPDLKFIITVSPVPLAATFTGTDIVAANLLSKATLRVAAARFAERHDDVDYFPSYEMALHSRTNLAFKDDKRHVQNKMVHHIVCEFLSRYLGVQDVGGIQEQAVVAD